MMNRIGAVLLAVLLVFVPVVAHGETAPDGAGGGGSGGAVQLQGVDRARQVAVGAEAFAVLHADGTVAVGPIRWMSPEAMRTAPVKLPFRATAVAAGTERFVALGASGQVATFGEGGAAPRVSMERVRAVSAGPNYFAAIRSDGSVWVASLTGEGEAVQLADVKGATAVAAGSDTVWVLDGGGQLWEARMAINEKGLPGKNSPRPKPHANARGFTAFGVYADGVTAIRGSGVLVSITVNEEGVKMADVPDSGGMRAIRCSDGACVALRADGSVWTDGRDDDCDGTADRLTQVSGVQGAVSVAAGPRFGAAVRSDGTVWLWQLPASACKVSGLDHVRSVSAGDGFLLSIKDDGTAWVTDAKTGKSYAVSGPREAGSGMATGKRMALVGSDGSVWTGSITIDESGVHVTLTKFDGLDGIKEIALHGDLSYALRYDGRVFIFGGSEPGLGRTFVIPHVLEVSHIAAGPSGLLAMGADGTAWLSPPGSSSSPPVQVKELSSVVSVAGGGALMACAVDGRCAVVSVDASGPKIWGDPHVDEVAACASGGSSAVCVRADGTVWSSSVSRSSGQTVGAGQVTDLLDMVAVGASSTHGVGLMVDGTVWYWRAR